MKKIKKEKVHEELLEGQSRALLQDLHLLTRDGDLNADARRKVKQINHFAQLIKPAMDDVFSRHDEPLVVDFASGNAYLGFLLYDLFLQKRTKGSLLSVDARREFFARGKKRAADLKFSRLRFACGSIQEVLLPERLHVATALHACDRATDDVVARAVLAKVDWLFLVPCCQAEVARLLRATKKENPLAVLSREPLHGQVFASHLTNVLRLLFLESCGYQVTVTELTSWEHTAKGELLMAKRIKAYDVEAKRNFRQILETFDLEGKWFPEAAEIWRALGHPSMSKN